MRDESHLDDMRSAIRGDFERLAERRGAQELMRTPDDEPQELPPQPEPPEASVPEPEPEPEPEIALEPEPAAGPEPESAATSEEPRRRSFLDRLLGR